MSGAAKVSDKWNIPLPSPLVKFINRKNKHEAENDRTIKDSWINVPSQNQHNKIPGGAYGWLLNIWISLGYQPRDQNIDKETRLLDIKNNICLKNKNFTKNTIELLKPQIPKS